MNGIDTDPFLCEHGRTLDEECASCDARESLRTQLAEATARAERAERDAVVVRDGHWDAVIAERDGARAQLAAVHQELLDERKRSMSGTDYERGFDDGVIRGREKMEAQLAEARAEIEQLRSRRCSGLVLAHHRMTTRFAGHGDVFDREFNELGLPPCGEIRDGDVADFDMAVAKMAERAEQAESLCIERGEQVATLFGQLRDMQVRAEKAEARVLSEEAVRTIRRELGPFTDDYQVFGHSRERIAKALAELSAKYPADGGSDG